MKPSRLLGLLVILVIIFSLGGMIWREWKGPYFSSPSEPREAKREEVERYTVPARFQGKPLLRLSEIGGIPEFTFRENTNGSLDVLYTHSEEKEVLEEVFTVIEADENLEATLANGETIRVAALGLTMPEDVPKLGNSSKSLYREDVDWMDPVTREPQEKLPWQKKVPSFERPTLHLAITKSGDSPQHLLTPDVFDAKTMAQVCGMRSYGAIGPNGSYGAIGPNGSFNFRLETWHSTDLLVVIPMVYGEPETGEISLKKGGRIEFDGTVCLTTVFELPGKYRSNGSSASYSGRYGNPADYEANMVLGEGKNSEPGSKNVGILVWPSWAHEDLEYQNPSTEEWRPISAGSGGLTVIRTDESWFNGEDAKLKVRRLPHFAKVVFRIKALPGFPESQNLFSTPIKKVVVGSEFDFTQAVAMAVQTKNDISKWDVDLDHLQWPMTFENTTPLDLLLELQRLSDTPLYFDDKQFIITPEFPEPFWMPWKEKATNWWEKIAP